MKSLLALATLGSIIAPQATLAHHLSDGWVGTEEEICYREEYQEVYVPGTRSNPGFVDYELVIEEVPCRRRARRPYYEPYHEPTRRPYEPQQTNVDDNSCIEGSIIGGILGGAAVAAGSRGPDMAWAIPLGVVGGSLVGCQVDGG